ncbi:hypothetical protein LCGC14_0221100 [marine sediment metagenome]|uniref:Uncharacterized protein n=1 Tax=marine sediment metagenome TaxID=412755 RepID=A0A0F9UUR1_9ZZZZ
MTQVMIDVNDKRIDEAVRKELKRLEGQVKRLKLSNAKLKSQIRDQQELETRARKIVNAAEAIVREYNDEE